ncbi:MAG: M15 family metallopeptidase [Atopobiaceae bacterium]
MLPENGERYTGRSIITAYTITSDGVRVSAFKKYGFSWGGDWSSVKGHHVRSCRDGQSRGLSHDELLREGLSREELLAFREAVRANQPQERPRGRRRLAGVRRRARRRTGWV